MEYASRLRLLYLDKDVRRQGLFGQTLEPLKYGIDYTGSGHAALERIMMGAYDLVAIRCDIQSINAIEFIEAMQQWPKMPSVLVMTKLGDYAIAAKALEKGASNYIIIDEEEAWLTMLPIVIRKIIRRHQLENEKREMLFTLQDRNRALSYLNLVGADLTSILEPEQVMTRLMRYAIEVLGAEGSSIWLWTDESQTHLECQAVIHRTSTPPLKGVKMAAGDGIVGWTGQNNRSTIINRVATDARFAKDVDSIINFNTESLLAVPLRVRGKVFGVLEFVNKLIGQFDESDQSLAETLAHSAATALENARLVESLRLSKAILQERNAELDAFGHTVAHDLQNMLARVVGFSEYLLEETELADGDAIPQSLVTRASRVIARDSRKMSKVIEALMLLSAVREAQVELRAVDTHHLITEVTNRLSDRIKSTATVISCPETWPTALAFAPWVEEVWYNYLSNALKYGGSPPEIQLGATLQKKTGMIQFWVQDNGHGIPEELRSELFRPFTDYGRNRKTGAGLGLSIVERIITRMNGAVGVECEIGKGSQFWFTLPIYSGVEKVPKEPNLTDAKNHVLPR